MAKRKAKGNKSGDTTAALHEQVTVLSDQLAYLWEAQMAAAVKTLDYQIREALPPKQANVQPCLDNTNECNCKRSKKDDGGDFTCTLYIEKDKDTGLPFISPDNPHMYVRTVKKRKLVWIINKKEYDAGWQFLDPYPMRIGADDVANLPNTELANGPREMVYRLENGNKKLIVCFDPVDGVAHRRFAYQLKLVNIKGAYPAGPLPLDPIIENEGDCF